MICEWNGQASGMWPMFLNILFVMCAWVKLWKLHWGWKLVDISSLTSAPRGGGGAESAPSRIFEITLKPRRYRQQTCCIGSYHRYMYINLTSSENHIFLCEKNWKTNVHCPNKDVERFPNIGTTRCLNKVRRIYFAASGSETELIM